MLKINEKCSGICLQFIWYQFLPQRHFYLEYTGINSISNTSRIYKCEPNDNGPMGQPHNALVDVTAHGPISPSSPPPPFLTLNADKQTSQSNSRSPKTTIQWA